jgi:hypothetical protein
LALTLLIAPVVQAIIQVPPNNDIFFQTTGEQADLLIGDYYSSRDGDNIHHLVGINIPCLPNQIFAIELFDPEVYDAGEPGIGTETVDDEVRPLTNSGTPVGDESHFILRQPNGASIAEAVYGPYDPTAPAPPMHNSWVAFGTITLPKSPVEGDTCGNYTIEVWTGDELGVAERNDDDNAWKYRTLGNPDAAGNERFDPKLGPDGRLGTGDEVWVDIQKLSYQHNTGAAQSFYWFVDDGVARTWTGRNFDMDLGTDLCINVACEITYISPSGAVFAASVSGDRVWNPGQPGRGAGDIFTNAEPGP